MAKCTARQTVFNFKQYFKTIQEKAKVSFVILPTGDSHFIYNDEVISHEDYNKRFCVPLERFNLKGDNPDKTYVE